MKIYKRTQEWVVVSQDGFSRGNKQPPWLWFQSCRTLRDAKYYLKKAIREDAEGASYRIGRYTTEIFK